MKVVKRRFVSWPRYRLVPFLAVLPAAAQICHGQHAPHFQPAAKGIEKAGVMGMLKPP